MSKKILVEVCCGSVDDGVEAQRGGADRIELNSSLMLGGLTPSAGAVMQSKKQLNIPVMVMIRPRGGGFCYSDNEMSVMEYDVRSAIENGADGIVFGILREDGTVDEKRCERIINLCKDREVVFHRAFDVVPDPFGALDQLVNLGVKRILTKGQENTLFEGEELLKDLIKYSGDRIEILVGGVKPYNIESTVAKLGCNQVHIASFVSKVDLSVASRPHVFFGSELRPPEDRYNLADCGYIKAICDKLGKLSIS